MAKRVFNDNWVKLALDNLEHCMQDSADPSYHEGKKDMLEHMLEMSKTFEEEIKPLLNRVFDTAIWTVKEGYSYGDDDFKVLKKKFIANTLKNLKDEQL